MGDGMFLLQGTMYELKWIKKIYYIIGMVRLRYMIPVTVSVVYLRLRIILLTYDKISMKQVIQD